MGWAKLARKAVDRTRNGPYQLLNIAGFKVSPLTFKENVQLIMRAALTGQGLWVLTLNLEMAARAATDPNYRTVLRDVDLSVADGMPIVLLSRLGLTPRRIPERTCGIDIVERCLTHFPGRMGILGGRKPKAAIEKLRADPSRVVFIDDGQIDPAHLEPTIAALKKARCQLVFVALGVPKQDIVCQALRRACPDVVCLGVGGSFEVLGGFLPRAPEFMRASGLEWFYRLIHEPRRLGYRYLVLYPQAVPSLIAWIRMMRARRARSVKGAAAPKVGPDFG